MLNFTVGPVMSESGVLEFGAQSTPYFRTSEFSQLMLQSEALALKALEAPPHSRCVFLTTSGTGAMETLVMHVLNARDKVLVVNGGGFGERFAELCRLHGREMSEIRLSFGSSLREEDLEPFARQGYTALLVNMCETSSGVLYDMPLIARFCKRNGILLLVDAISSFIADELKMAEWGIAAVITGSQKALAVQPGIALVALAPEALQRVEENPDVSMYLSLKSALKNGERGQTPFTPAVTVLLQINWRLRSIDENGGVARERERICARAHAFRRGVTNLPFTLLAQSPSNAVTALKVKHGAEDITRILKDDYGIWVCPNGGEYADTVFRVGHIGYIVEADERALLDALYDMNAKGLLQ